MDMIQSPGAPAAAYAATRTRDPGVDAVKTDLPAKKAVETAEKAEKPAARKEARTFEDRAEVSANAKARREIELEFDKKANATVYKSIDSDSGEVVQQMPSDAFLKVRAYVRESAAPPPEPKVEARS